MKNIVVTGIGTGIGKTLVSAVLVEALEADYWKPVQSGNADPIDTNVLVSLISNQRSCFHLEAFRLNTPVSPHHAAEIDGVEIKIEYLRLPQTNNNLIIETAGGLMTPLNKKQLNIDLIAEWKLPVVLVSQNYLGSINHTLLSAYALKQRKIPVLGIVFNGEKTPASEKMILDYTGFPCIGSVPLLKEVNRESVRRLASEFKDVL